MNFSNYATGGLCRMHLTASRFHFKSSFFIFAPVAVIARAQPEAIRFVACTWIASSFLLAMTTGQPSSYVCSLK
ncbi:MAG: hypothetical protein LBJ47_07855 [Tannerella sp.]|nr:hypothetical protein [Tannerella sp.]